MNYCYTWALELVLAFNDFIITGNKCSKYKVYNLFAFLKMCKFFNTNTKVLNPNVFFYEIHSFNVH